MEEVKYSKQSNGVYHCHYHIVIVTKYRKKIFNAGVYGFFKKRLIENSRTLPTNILHRTKLRIHLLVSIPPKMSVGSVVRIIKSNTDRDLKKQYPFLKKCYFGTQSVWSDGYFVSTVGVNEAVIQRYIEYQGCEDLGQAWLDLK